MIDISPQPLAEVRGALGDLLPALLPALLPGNGVAEVPDDSPFVQLGYDELDGEEVDAILGYAGIPQANAPVGLPGEFTPYAPQDGWLLFPLAGLSGHLHTHAPVLAAEYARAGSFTAYADTIGEELSARDYLILGTLETIAYCNRHGLALQIRW